MAFSHAIIDGCGYCVRVLTLFSNGQECRIIKEFFLSLPNRGAPISAHEKVFFPSLIKNPIFEFRLDHYKEDL